MEVDGYLPKFISDYASVIKDKFELGGAQGVATFLTELSREWRSIPLRIAVAGRTGAGKSTFINAIRGLKNGAAGAAETDVVECTVKLAEYRHPDNEKLVFSDLPGYGTKEFPRNEYFKTMDFQAFDFVLILSSERFTEDDIWLAEHVRKNRKCFFFVRTKVANDIRGYNEGRERPEPEDETLSRIRKNCEKGLTSKNISDDQVFLIDSHEPKLYQFDELSLKLIQDITDTKRDAMILSLSTLTKGVIDEKNKVLQRRICYAAVISGTAGAVPVPGVGTAVDIPLLLEEAIMYRNQFGLHEEGINKAARWLHIPVTDLSKSLQLKSTGISFTTKGIVVLIREGFAKTMVKESAKLAIPVIGSIISAGASFWSTKIFLQNLLELMYSDAIKIHERMVEVIKSSTQV